MMRGQNPFNLYSIAKLKACPHLYANANKACGMGANANECQKVACSAFGTQVNEQAFRWLFIGCPNEYMSTSVQLRTYFSLKYRLQMDSVCLFAEHTPHKRMLFAHTSTLCVLHAFSHLFRVRIQMWARLYASILIVQRQSCTNAAHTTLMFSVVRLVRGLPSLGFTSTLTRPSRNWLNHSKNVVRDRHLDQMLFVTI